MIDASYRLERVADVGLPALPVSLAEFKKYARVDHDYDNLIVTNTIRAAASWLESVTGLVFITTEFVMKPVEWVLCLHLPRWPIQTVDAVKYVNTSGVLTTISASGYQYDVSAAPVVVVPAVNTEWPAVQSGTLTPIKIEFTAGYGDDADDVPFLAKQAICLLAAHMYDRRQLSKPSPESDGGEVPLGIMRVIEPLCPLGIIA